MAQPAQGNMLSTKQEKPLYTQEPFSKQLNRTKAVQGKLLEDIQMNRMLRGTHASGAADIIYDPNFESQSSSRDLGAVRTFGSQVGRLDMHRAGTRAAADGTFPNHWFPTKPPNDEFTRPARAAGGQRRRRRLEQSRRTLQGAQPKTSRPILQTRGGAITLFTRSARPVSSRCL
jgi:hypothetical protein